MSTMSTVTTLSVQERTSVKESFDATSLMDKWKDQVPKRSTKGTLWKATLGSNIIFWFLSLSMLYVMLGYVIPYSFSDYGPQGVFVFKILAIFAFVQSTANWACVRFMNTSILKSHEDSKPTNHTDSNGYHSNGNNVHSNVYHGNGDVGVHHHDSADDIQNGVYHHSEGGGSAIGGATIRKEDAWERCYVCQLPKPPRSHHCSACGKCILKRDHHCFMTGVCIGFFNQRYFMVFCFYLAICSFWGMYLMVCYLHHHAPSHLVWYDYFLPCTVIKWLMGYMPLHIFIQIVLCYFLWWSGPAGLGFFVWQVMVIAMGKTTYELRRKVRVKSYTSIKENFKSVFGNYWLINFIFPAVHLFHQEGDGKQWPGIKQY